MRTLTLFALLLLPGFTAFAQNTQTIRGKVVDKESKSPLIGVVVSLYRDSSYVAGAVSDLDGNYRLQNVTVGRYSVNFRFIGYQPASFPTIVNSGKENIIDVELDQSVITKQ